MILTANNRGGAVYRSSCLTLRLAVVTMLSSSPGTSLLAATNTINNEEGQTTSQIEDATVNPIPGRDSLGIAPTSSNDLQNREESLDPLVGPRVNHQAAPDFTAPIDVIPSSTRSSKNLRPRLPSVDFDSLDRPVPVPSRWDSAEVLLYPSKLWDPYHGNNPLKADVPIDGKNWFFNLGLSSITRLESRYLPAPVAIATSSQPNSLDVLGNGKQQFYSQDLIIDTLLYKGDTVFRPPELAFRFTPVINFNKVTGEEVGVLNVDPRAGNANGTGRSDSFVGIQALYADVHLRDVSARYDFDSIRIGIQPFSADFRGFLFLDQPFGIRLFGTRKNNVYQYNLAWFRRLEKDTNSGLNDISEGLRDDDVLVANVYWQDMMVSGLRSQFSFIYNRNTEGGAVKYDTNGFVVRPASLFEARGARDYEVSYLGWSNEGHIGRINLSSSFYYATGSGTSEVLQNEENDISAFFLALETSYDINWMRFRVSYLYASGDKDPYDDVSQGFDSIVENPLFAGADSSYYIHQSISFIGGGGVALSSRNSLLNSLRSSKEQGQSNFTNPGLVLFGLGADFNILTQLRGTVNLNKLAFEDTTTLEALRQQAGIDNNIGLDFSMSLEYRPWLTQNFITSIVYSQLLPGKGYKSLYGDSDTPFAFSVNLILSY
ncbi:MAG: hypothetical protein ACC707_04630 [Thiohalomonadales bacterium]